MVAVIAFQKSGDRRPDGVAARGASDEAREAEPGRESQRKDAVPQRPDASVLAPSRLGASALESAPGADAGAGARADATAGARVAVRPGAKRAVSTTRTHRPAIRRGTVSIIVFDGDEPVDGAAVFLDGKRLGGRKDIQIDVGQHEFTATATGIGKGRIVKRIEAGRNRDVEIHLKR